MALMKGDMRRIEEVYSRDEIKNCIWSDRFDLIAITHANGAITIRRMNWKYVWQFQSPQIRMDIKLISWCPDGKLLAVIYENETLYIMDIDRKKTVNIISLNAPASSMYWTEEETTENRIQAHALFMKLARCCETLPKFAINDGTYMGAEAFQKIKSKQPKLNYLIVGLRSGQIHVYIYGMIMCGTLDVKEYLQFHYRYCEIIYANISKSLRRLYVVLRVTDVTQKPETVHIRYAIFNIDRFLEYAPDVYALTDQCNDIFTLMSYMDHAMRAVEDAWGGIVANEMLLKLNKYDDDNSNNNNNNHNNNDNVNHNDNTDDINSNSSGSRLTADFLEMFMFGTYIKRAEDFIRKELNENQLKRISSTIDVYHRVMAKLIMDHLKPASDYLTAQLVVFKGVLKSVKPTTNPTVTDNVIEKCIAASAAYSMKLSEMLTVLEESKLKYKAFFRWLNTIYTIIAEDDYPSATRATEITQREIKYVTDYIVKLGRLTDVQRSSDDGQHRHSHLGQEQLGQYLLNENLAANSIVTVRKSNSFWSNYLKNNPQLFEASTIVIPAEFNYYSLTKQSGHLKGTLIKLFECFSDYITGTSCTLSTVKTAFRYVQRNNNNAVPSVTKILSAIDESRNSLTMAVLLVNNDGDNDDDNNNNTFLDIFDLTDDGRIVYSINGSSGNPEKRIRLNFNLDGGPNVVTTTNTNNNNNNTANSVETVNNGDNDGDVNRNNSSRSNVDSTFYNEPNATVYRLLDVQFYTGNTLSLLLRKGTTSNNDDLSSYYTQLPIDMIRKWFDVEIDTIYSMFRLVGKDLRVIKNMKAIELAVSGSRRVAMMLAADRHYVRTFEMEAERDEDTIECDTSYSLYVTLYGDSRSMLSVADNSSVSVDSPPIASSSFAVPLIPVIDVQREVSSSSDVSMNDDSGLSIRQSTYDSSCIMEED